MSSEKKIDPFFVMILVLSIIGAIVIPVSNFAGFQVGGYSYYACLDCEYSTDGDIAAQIMMIILLILQAVVVLNELLPKRYIDKDLTIVGLGLAGLTILFAIIGIASFGAEYDEAPSWWPATGFYGGIIPGIINMILFFLKYKNKV